MNGIDALKSLLHAEHLRTVASRANTCVYEALTPNGPVYAKVSTDRTAQDRQYELLKALDGFELAPKLVSRFDLGEQLVLVTHAVPGMRLDTVLANASCASRLSLFASAGHALGQLHRAISPAQLRKLQFWRIRDKAATDSFSWNLHLRAMVNKWSSRIDPTSADYDLLKAPLAQLITYAIELPESAELRLLHCDYIGRNILTHSDNTVSGILDFEAARVGDAAYDLAKIVWANMDFTDIEARHKLLDGWEQAYGERVHKQAFLYYVGVQCLAAIAWTDTNPPLEGGDAFRSSAIKALQAAVLELKQS